MAQKFLNGIDVSSTTVVNGSNLNSGSTVLDVQGSQGQLFSVTNGLTGDLFSVSDISGIPILNINSSGAVDIDGTLNLGDSDKIQLGASQDLQIYHDGSNSYIDDASGAGSLYINTNAFRLVSANKGENMIRAYEDGAVILSHNSFDKLTTTSDGVTITGNAGMATGHSSGKFAVMSTSVHGSYDFYNNGTSYLNGAVTVDAAFTQSGGGASIFSGSINAPGLVYDATNKYLSISHWSSPPTPAAMLHLSDNSNSLDVPQIRIEGRENPGDTVLDIAVKDADVRFNLVEGSTDAASGYGRMHFKTNASANSSNPTRGGFLFQSGPNSSLINVLDITNEGNATFAGNINGSGYIQASGLLYLRSSVQVMNKAADGFLTLAARDVTGAEVVYNISNVGTLTAAGKISGGEIEGTSLDINGNADISGTLTVHNTLTVNKSQGSSALTINHAGNGGWTQYASTNDGVYGYIGAGAHLLSTVVNDNDFVIRAQEEFAVSIAATEKMRINSSGNATFAGNISAGSGTFSAFVYAEDEIHLTDAGTTRAKLLLNSSDRDNVELRAESLGSTMKFFTVGTEALELDASQNATFAGNIVMAANATVDGVDISGLPTSFAPTNAEQNVQSDWNATSGDAQILNKLTREFDPDNWGDDRFVRTVTGTGVGGADTGDKWVHLSNVDISGAYEKVKIEFTIGSYDDNARGDERIAVLYENHSSAQEGHILHWYKGDQIPTLFKAVKSIRSASSGLTNTYDLYVQIDGAWKDNFTVHAEWWKTHTNDSTITYPTTVGGSTPTAGSDDQSLTSRERWIDADMLDGYHLSTTRNLANTVPVRDANGYLQLGWINTTSGVTTATINKIYVSDDNYIRYITPATFRTDIINDYYLPIGGGTLTGNLKVVGSIESRKNIVSNNNYNIAQISSTRTTDDYGGLNKTYAKLDVQTPGPNTDGASSAHGLGHLSIKLADNAGNSDLVQKALLRHDGELILGGFYPQTSETELAGLTIRSRYAGSNRNFLRFQTDHSSATTEWTMAKIYAGDGGNFNGQMFFQVATGSNASNAYTSGHDAQLETAMFIDDTKEVTFNSHIKLAGANPYIQGTGSGQMRIKHTSGETMYIRPDETGALSFFEGANSQSVYFMTQTPTVNNTTNESAQLKFHTRSKQSDGQNNSKYATIKHLTHSIGFNYTTLDFAGSDKSKFNMPIEAAGGLYFTGDTHMGFVPHPRGAQYRSDNSSDTGYIMIKLPTDIGNSPDDMISFYVDIYDYATSETISVFVGGYNYRHTPTSSNWVSPTAIINTKLAAKDFNVRFGHDGTNFYVAIGETTSVWSYPSIVVRDFQCSFRGNVEHYIDGWAISTETTTLSGVDETQTGNLPQATHATTATTANAVAWGNITSRPYIETSAVTSATTTTTIASISGTTYAAVFFDYVIFKSSNIRAGTVVACSDGTSVSFTETSTTDLGDTSDVTLAVDLSSSNFRLRATTTSSTWTIKSLIRAI